MPSLVVAPEGGGVLTAGGPSIGGVTFRRPTARTETTETLRLTVELGNGSTRTYDKGVRPVYAYAWSSLTDAEVNQLRAVTTDPYALLEREAGEEPVSVSTEDGVSAEAIPGTYPVRYSASVTLRARDPIR